MKTPIVHRWAAVAVGLGHVLRAAGDRQRAAGERARADRPSAPRAHPGLGRTRPLIAKLASVVVYVLLVMLAVTLTAYATGVFLFGPSPPRGELLHQRRHRVTGPDGYRPPSMELTWNGWLSIWNSYISFATRWTRASSMPGATGRCPR